MTQAQLDAVHFSLVENELTCVLYEPKEREITGCVNDKLSLIVKRSKLSTSVILRERHKRLILTPDIF